METLCIPPSSHKFLDFDDYAFASESLHHNFNIELEIDHENEKLEEQKIFLDYDDFAFGSGSFDHDFSFKIKIDHDNEKHEEDFNFTCVIPQESLVTADEIFHDGKIQPLFPIIDKTYDAKMGLFRDLPLKKMALDSMKSNSTGFSKMLRCRKDIELRSYSNGKDAFVFLNPPAPAKKTHDVVKVRDDVVKNNAKRKMMTPSSSAHEKLYMMNRKRKENEKRRSFLPYKKHLFGFFANMNIFSKNIHPF